MGRGNSKIKANSGIRSQNGGVIESSTPLIYGNRDPNVNGIVRDGIISFEESHLSDELEDIVFLTADGVSVGEVKKRAHDGVDYNISYYDMRRVDTMSHNHPRSPEEGNVLGGTFSQDDISGWVDDISNGGHYTMRASASEGVYSITALDGFRGRGLSSQFGKARKASRERYEFQCRAADGALLMGGISQSEHRKVRDKAFNDMVISNHNWLLDHQDRYNYHYTLEHR